MPNKNAQTEGKLLPKSGVTLFFKAQYPLYEDVVPWHALFSLVFFPWPVSLRIVDSNPLPIFTHFYPFLPNFKQYFFLLKISYSFIPVFLNFFSFSPFSFFPVFPCFHPFLPVFNYFNPSPLYPHIVICMNYTILLYLS